MSPFSSTLTKLTLGALSLTLVSSEALAQERNTPQQDRPSQAQPSANQPRSGTSSQQGTAQQGKQQAERPLTESADEARRRTDKPRQVSGTILSMKTVGIRGSDVQNRVALIRTNKGNKRLVVDLGPEQELKGLNTGKGQRISVQGRVVRVGDRQLLVAERVRQNDQTRQLQRTAQMRASQAQRSGQQGSPGQR